ncbi:AAA family ATPase [Niallia taxi]|uniref:AAA family ATPase n=1 Tax=Niallia taxi TaxID=2499688 RepID=UPI00254AC8C0|nr:AAA family ATPase [Niallia taxi]MDK8641281.1 AAA family ATPase [Niallia taxi]MED4055002.1 AAA family ATPase [Niallia taxi]MED4119816.1 AAA family ATPase [Niallia taxi]
MFIEQLNIKNYKKLKDVKFCLSQKQNLFIGPNNSGKTSAIEVLVKFLTDKKSFNIYDVTIANWGYLDELFSLYYSKHDREEDKNELDDLYLKMMQLLPTLKVTLKIEETELYHVKSLIPYLNKECEKVALTYTYEPINFEKLLIDYKNFKESVSKWKSDALENHQVELAELDEIAEDHWPSNFKSFLATDNRFKKYFTIKYYISNPDLEEDKDDIFDETTVLSVNPLKNIVKVSVIGAQRGLIDSNEDGDTIDGAKINLNNTRKLSKLFSTYYSDYLNPINQYSEKDFTILNAVTTSKKIFKEHLEESIKPIQKKMGDLGYPGFGSPSITVRPQINLSDSIKGEASLLLNTHKDGINDEQYFLPEHNNGLGYQNLIAMFFKLNIFKQERLAFGGEHEKIIEPLHIVLIEEPEAHLHAQAQKVFIDKAFQLIELSPEETGIEATFTTQLLISTHSSHITYKADFDELIYFNRKLQEDLFSSDVISLREVTLDPGATFNNDGKQLKGLTNKKFVQKYLQLNEHDLFFADAVILIEGVSERILLPELIRKHVSSLTARYITILEVGGAYANRFIPFLKLINRPTLIITDIDSVRMDGNKTHVNYDEELKSSNSTINQWFRKSSEERSEKKRIGKLKGSKFSESVLDDKLINQLINKSEEEKINYPIRLAYQYEMYNKNVYARTFEDAIALTNFKMFKNFNVTDNDFSDLIANSNTLFKEVEELSKMENQHVEQLFTYVNAKNVKSEFALDLLFIDEIAQEDELECPRYILEGLMWLEEQLKTETINKVGKEEEVVATTYEHV